MLLKFGALVRSRDDHVVGTVDRLILDPASGDLKVVAINIGLLLPHDVEAPATAVVESAEDGLRLAIPAEDVHGLPRFIEATYTLAGIPPLESAAGPSGTIVLPTGMLMGQPVEESLRVTEASRQLALMYSESDLTNAVVADGATIRSRDGQHVGDLHALDFDPATDHLLGITLRHGRLMSELLDLPASVVACVDDGVVHLKVDAEWLHTWAGLEPGLEVWTADRVCLGSIERRLVDSLIVSQDGGHRPLHVPMLAVDHISQNRLLLAEDHARAVLWADEG
jgi:hypothetical protein